MTSVVPTVSPGAPKMAQEFHFGVSSKPLGLKKGSFGLSWRLLELGKESKSSKIVQKLRLRPSKS